MTELHGDRTGLYAQPEGGHPIRCAVCGGLAGMDEREISFGPGLPTVHTTCVTTHWHEAHHVRGLDLATQNPAKVTCALCRCLPGCQTAARRQRRTERIRAARSWYHRRTRWQWPAREKLSVWLYPGPRDGEW